MTAQEQPARGMEPREDFNQQGRGVSASVVGALAISIIAAGQPPIEPQSADNGVLLLSGDHGGARLTKPGTILAGQPGARVRLALSISADATVRDLLFDSPGALAFLVAVSNNATVVFQNCRFRKKATDTGDYVTLTSGCKAHFIGCFFEGTPSVGNVVNNAGAALNCFIIGCSNKTGRVHVNVTTLAETA